MATILVIEDDEDLLGVMAQTLRGAGYDVTTASEGKTGLAHYHSTHHDLIITDIVMPDTEGLELIGKLRHTAPRPRIIAISGTSSFSLPVYLPAAKKLGAQRAIGKPVRPDALLKIVAEVLAEPAPTRAPERLPGESGISPPDKPAGAP